MHVQCAGFMGFATFKLDLDRWIKFSLFKGKDEQFMYFDCFFILFIYFLFILFVSFKF